MQENKNSQTIYAGFFVRAAAYFVDRLLVLFVTLVIRIPFSLAASVYAESPLKAQIFFRFTVIDIVLYLLASAYFIATTYDSGQTLGKRAFQIKVVGKGNQRLSLLTVIYRETIGRYLSGVIFFLGYLFIGTSAEKTAIHDMLCDTRVIYICKMKPQFPPRQPGVPPLPPYVSPSGHRYPNNNVHYGGPGRPGPGGMPPQPQDRPQPQDQPQAGPQKPERRDENET